MFFSHKSYHVLVLHDNLARVNKRIQVLNVPPRGNKKELKTTYVNDERTTKYKSLLYAGKMIFTKSLCL